MAMGPVDNVVSGQALDSFGFDGTQETIAGLGLNTFGFLWPCDAIWSSTETSITTTWTSLDSSTNIETCKD